MAQALLGDTKLRLVFEVGVDEKGNPILKTKTLNNIKKDSTADELSQAANALASLSKDVLSSVERTDNSEIIG
ncbi:MULTISPECIES: DUF1659 domain-containing protein [unclassified Bacillus (in: firmicutes)]|uniref:DUF1659 domain-containing protein n=1 Tax=unclassified Bacillus (in: firmicutes) TaxID=185979 RepID=UPI0008EB1C56|nr:MULTISPECIES: DUF1659 domain-containing protein [unclassified Bacillus (in: firmicutes)]SFA72061.1 Protein of unknown function [Bacillus sp. UNCCL13]SFQ62333.1 Protein of unknown function [Bacillus sp. cl95]